MHRTLRPIIQVSITKLMYFVNNNKNNNKVLKKIHQFIMITKIIKPIIRDKNIRAQKISEHLHPPNYC